MREKKKKDDFEDDGRVIADMNLEGMPWNNPKPYRLGFGRKPGGNMPGARQDEDNTNTQPEIPPLTKKETRRIAANAMLAGLGVAMVFVIAAALFILFCVHVWFA